MSWMAAEGAVAPEDSDGLDTAGTPFPEDVLDAVVPLLHPDQAEPEVDGEVADHVARGLVADLDLEHATVGRPDAESRVDQGLREQPVGVGPTLHLDQQVAGLVQEVRRGRGAEQAPVVEDDDVVAYPLQLA